MANLPGAIEALVGLVNSLNLGVQVFDGDTNDDVGTEVITVGITSEELGIEGTQRHRGVKVREKRYAIHNMVAVGTGDTELSPVRARAFGLFDAVEAAVENNPTLNGAATYAAITSMTYRPDLSGDGIVVTIDFSVQVTFL